MTRWVVYPFRPPGCVHLFLSSALSGRGERSWCGRLDPALITTDGRMVTCKTCRSSRAAWRARHEEEDEHYP